MANILLLGNPDSIRRFASHALPDPTLYVLPPDMPAEQAGDRLVVIRTLPEASGSIDAVIDLEWRPEAASRRQMILSELADHGVLLFVNTLTATATAVAAELGGRSTIGFSFVPALFAESTTFEMAASLQSSPEDLARALALMRTLVPKEIEVVEDRVALLSLRVLGMIINEAAFALMEGVAGAEDIDVAMKLGTNYPEGPLRWADRMGADLVVAVLQALYEEYQEERYRPCVLLKQYARAGRSFHAAA